MISNKEALLLRLKEISARAMPISIVAVPYIGDMRGIRRFAGVI
jgi:hypothetical protein